MASKPPPKKPMTGEELKKNGIWKLGPLGEKIEKETFDPAKAWLKDPKDVKHSKQGGKKRRTLRKRKSTKKRIA